MSKGSILFIVNGNTQIGYGHISRIKIISEEFNQNGYECYFLLPEDCPFISSISEDNKNIILVPSFEKEAIELLIRHQIEKHNINIVLLDLIELEYKKFEWLRSCFTDVMLVSITLFLFELNTRYEHISFFPQTKSERARTFRTKYGNLNLFVGPQYLTFRKEFAGLTKEIKKDAKRLLITMGGSDPSNLTKKALEAILDKEYEITVILSPVAPSFNNVKKLASSSERIRLIERSNNISKEMLDNDVLVINGGLTRYESCLTQTPFIAISIHEKQYQITKELSDLGIGINLGVGKQLSEVEIQNSIHSLLNDYDLRFQMSKKMKSLFDVHGAKRIFSKIVEERKSF